MAKNPAEVTQIPEPAFARFLFADTRIAALWLLIRLYVGWQWLEAGWGKVQKPVWVGDQAGVALSGFVQGAIAKSTGEHPAVQGWYAEFLHKKK